MTIPFKAHHGTVISGRWRRNKRLFAEKMEAELELIFMEKDTAVSRQKMIALLDSSRVFPVRIWLPLPRK
ncbi:MAG: hypothetical protein MZV63_43565 [Marinilabiliales bacterium]|nr:hypothetical protein [Marinilabiliales bacterium]